ncbi:MAG: hypothetical protein ACK46S_09315 [Bacteroidota bacterium]|jgi:hypothetical protein
MHRIQLSNDRKTLEIPSIADATKLKILMVWFILWTISGMIVFTQFFVPTSRDVKVWYAVWMAFWAYFEYKASVLLSYRRKGKEILQFSESGFTFRRDINGRGIDKVYERAEIKNIRTVDFKDKKVIARVQPLYWNMGYETVLFDYKGKEEALGLQLTEEEAQQLVKIMKQRLNKG